MEAKRRLEELKQEVICKPFFDAQFSVPKYAEELLREPTSTDQLVRAVDSLNSIIKDQVSAAQVSLVSQACNVSLLSKDLKNLQAGIGVIHQRLLTLKSQLQEPHQLLEARIRRLENVQRATQLLRKIIRFVSLAKKLKQQMKIGGGLEQANAAEILEQLDKLRSQEDLKGIDVVDNETEWILRAKQNLLKTADRFLITGCSSQNQSDTANACQIYFNLHCLREVILETVEKIQKRAVQAIEATLHGISSIGSGSLDGNEPESRSRDTAQLWKLLEGLFQELYNQTLQILHLQQVLQKTPHPHSPKHTLWSVVISEVPDRLENSESPVGVQKLLDITDEETNQMLLRQFWTEVTHRMAAMFKTAALSHASLRVSIQRAPLNRLTEETLLANALTSDYPRLLRLLFDVLQRLETHELRLHSQQVIGRTGKDHVSLSSSSMDADTQSQLLLNTFDWCQNGYLSKFSGQLEQIVGYIPVSPQSPPPSIAPTLAFVGTSSTGSLSSSSEKSREPWDQHINVRQVTFLANAFKSQVDVVCIDEATRSTLLPLVIGTFAKVIEDNFIPTVKDHVMLPNATNKAAQVTGPINLVQQHNAAIYNTCIRLLEETESILNYHSIKPPGPTPLPTTISRTTSAQLKAKPSTSGNDNGHDSDDSEKNDEIKNPRTATAKPISRSASIARTPSIPDNLTRSGSISKKKNDDELRSAVNQRRLSDVFSVMKTLSSFTNEIIEPIFENISQSIMREICNMIKEYREDRKSVV